MQSGDVVRLVNEGDTAFKDSLNSREYIIPPGGQLFVDFDAMCLWLGHPEANDFDPRNRVRVAEYHRLRGRYGVDAKALEQTLQGIAVDADELFQQLRPKLAAYDSAGGQILTVADDPSGDSLHAPPEDMGDNQSLILARMAQLEQEIANLRAQSANNQRTEQALNDAMPLSNDNPDLSPDQLPVGASGIPGTIITSSPEPQSAPRPPARTAPGEDTPTRVRVSGG